MKVHEIMVKEKDSTAEKFRENIVLTRIKPPNLRLVACCSQCKYARTEGLSVECRKFTTNGIVTHAICDEYEES